MKKTVVVGLYGGPGSGKSTMASRIFPELKDLGINCEIAAEYAKDVTWQKGFHILGNQLYIFAKQQHRVWRLNGQVDVIITDSPLLLSLVYGENMSDSFKSVVLEEFNKTTNLNIFLKRTKPYNTAGRSQTLEEAKELDDKIFAEVGSHIDFDLIVPGEKESVPQILGLIQNKLNDILDEELTSLNKLTEERDLIKKEKNEFAKMQKYEKASALRDREKELSALIENKIEIIYVKDTI